MNHVSRGALDSPVDISLDSDANALGFLTSANGLQRDTSGQMDDVDLSFLSDLLSQDSGAPLASSTPSPSSSNHSMTSSESVDSTELILALGSERKRKLAASPDSGENDEQLDERDERRRMLSAKNARRYRSRKKVSVYWVVVYKLTLFVWFRTNWWH
ncbi:hypothetical protein V7S43_002760 [Phytophthora oleae]|uniref:BZIP domain-containing protein n=1 Tax=Phytophthora oleae TaxID=2107226 RepID=A0ABD3G0B2_9STRA